MEIQGLDELVDTLNNASNNFEKEASKKLNKIAKEVLKDAKDKTPIDTGVLKDSWLSKKKGNLERIVYNNKHYAPHIEYGHRTKNKKGFVEGKYMLTRAVKKAEENLEESFSILIENLWK